MKTFLKVVGVMFAMFVLSAGGFFLWAKSAAADKLTQRFEIHRIDFPVPFPLSEDELGALRSKHAAKTEAAAGQETDENNTTQASLSKQEPADPLAGIDLKKIALERALARGKHLVNARYVCVECHGKDFGGGVMIDSTALGRLLGPNITAGMGGRVRDYKTADWDRIVRHGIKLNGLPAVMPSEDFQLMSDQELSDIVAYIKSQPPKHNVVPAVSLGPVGTILMATGKLPLSAALIHNHDAKHALRPPQTAETKEFGKHLAGVCTGCHRQTLEGGPVVPGDPGWPPAQNLTPHADGLKGWSFEQFETLMRTGKRADGSGVKLPMTLMIPYTGQLKDVEMKALWMYISGVAAKPTGQ